MSSPSNIVYLIANSNLENTYKNSYTFESEYLQNEFFKSKAKYTVNDISTIRNKQKIKVPFNEGLLFDVDYLAFQNKDFSFKWFYCFITEINYVNENTSEITLEIDFFQTWYFDLNLSYCYIERKHVEDDLIGLHTVPEGLELGDYVVTSEEKAIETRYNIIMLATEYLEGAIMESPSIVGNSAISCYWLNVNYDDTGLAVVKSYIDAYALAGKSSAIVGLFLQPETYGSTQKTVRINTVSAPSRRLTKTPLNNKLYTYPFCCLAVESPQNASLFKYEDLGSLDFSIYGGFGASMNLICYPNNYKGVSNNYENSVSFGGFPILPYVSNFYENWIAQNSPSINAQKNEVSLGLAMGTVSLGAGLATGGLGLAFAGVNALNSVSGAFNTINKINASVEQAKIIPDQFNGSTNAIDILISNRQGGFKLQCKSIKEEYVEIIDNYFSMFGYKVNSLEIPKFKTRPSYNYLKMASVTLNGSIPNNAKNVIIKMFENGITLWHGDFIGDYGRENKF